MIYYIAMEKMLINILLAYAHKIKYTKGIKKCQYKNFVEVILTKYEKPVLAIDKLALTCNAN